MSGSKFSGLFGNGTSSGKTVDIPDDLPMADEEEEDLGACAAIAKNKWVTALTLKHAKGPWESYQYTGLATRSLFEPTHFWVKFVDEDATWHIEVKGRNLERIYHLVIQRRLEWLRAADRDFAGNGQPIVLSVTATKVEEPKGGK